MILGGILLSIWGGFKKRIVTSLTGIALFSFAILAIALAPADKFWIMLASMFAFGFLLPFVNGPIHALFQSLVEPNMQGRVMSLLNSVAGAMMPVSLLVAGPVSDATSLQTWFWIAGILNFALAITAFFIPALINIEQNHHSNAIEPETATA
jgi:DHA3 family macrolide efflux protein-like MFS transporter